jgi:uncharacterized membrane protein
MNKTQSLIIKGSAILMMVFLHLFNNAGYVAEHCNNICTVSGLPLATWLTRAMIPVALFIFISGYGLEKRREEKRREEKRREERDQVATSVLVILDCICNLRNNRTLC